MDNLTHTAVGLFLSRAGFKNYTPRATPILILAANIPDIDIVSAAGGSLNYLHYHRHWTHSLAALPLMALLAVAIVHLVGRKRVNWVAAWIAGMSQRSRASARKPARMPLCSLQSTRL